MEQQFTRGTISALEWLINPHAPRDLQGIFDECDVLASIDTLILFSSRWPKGTLAKVNELQRGLQPSWFDRCETDNYCWGLVLNVQQPRRETLLHLASIQKRYKIKVSRIDVAYDFIGRDEEHKRSNTKWLRGHVLLLYRRKAYLREDEQTVSWIEQTGRNRRSSKDVVLYDDGHCKPDGQADCSHLELKLYDARTIQRLGLCDIGNLIDLNPQTLFARMIKLTRFDVEQYVNRCIQRSIGDFRKRKQGKGDDTFTDNWNNALHRRLRTIMDKKFQHSAQRAKDILGDKRVNRDIISTDNLRLPKALSWPMSSSSSIKSLSTSQSHRALNGQSGALKSLKDHVEKGVNCVFDMRGRDNEVKTTYDGRSMSVNENPDRSFYDTMYPRRGRANKKRRTRHDNQPKKQTFGFLNPRPLTEDEEEELLELEFINEMRSIGRDDLADDESGVCFEHWLKQRRRRDNR